MSQDQTTHETRPGGIYAAMVAVMADIEPIGKAQENREQHFRYRGIDDVYNMLQPLMAKHGVFMTINVRDRAVTERSTKAGNAMQCVALTVDYAFFHTDGSFVECTVIGEGRDTADKATNKAMAAAHKYALLQTFCIPTDGQDDPDRETPEALAPEQSRQTRNRRAPAQRTYDLSHIASDMATQCPTPEALKDYFAKLCIPKEHPQRRAIIDLMMRAKDALDANAPPTGPQSADAPATEEQIAAIRHYYADMHMPPKDQAAHMSEFVGHRISAPADLTAEEADTLIAAFETPF